MRPLLLVPLFFLLLPCAFPAPDKQGKDEIKPILSPAGIKRLLENVKTLEQNIRDAQGNLSTCEKNLKVLQGELSELASLEKEHGELRTKLYQYLENAKTQMAKNKAESQKVTKAFKDIEKTPRVEGDTARRNQLMDKLRMDEAELARWKTDADTKVKRIGEMIREIATSLGEISARRGAVKADIDVWTKRKSEYDKLLAHYRDKKNESETLIRMSSK